MFDAIGKNAIGKNVIGKNAIGKNAIGKNAIGKNAIGKNAIGKNAIGKNAIGKNEHKRIERITKGYWSRCTRTRMLLSSYPINMAKDTGSWINWHMQ